MSSVGVSLCPLLRVQAGLHQGPWDPPGWWHVKGHHGHVTSEWLTLLMSAPLSSSLETDADASKGKQTWDDWHLYKGLVNFAEHSILLLTTASLLTTLLALL